MESNNSLTPYIKENKSDILTYSWVLIIVTVILLIVSYKTNCYFMLLLDIFSLGALVNKINVKFNLRKIEKYLIDNNLFNEIGKIEYWNEENYFLTENYVIILIGKNVKIFSYSDIISISKKTEIKAGNYLHVHEYVVITLLNGEQYKILSFTTKLVNEQYMDISNFLLNKNSNIIQK